MATLVPPDIYPGGHEALFSGGMVPASPQDYQLMQRHEAGGYHLPPGYPNTEYYQGESSGELASAWDLHGDGDNYYVCITAVL